VKASDAKKIRALLAWAAEQEETRELREDEEHWQKAFKSMLDNWRPLTEPQRSWVEGVAEKVLGEITYENLWSAGKVPRGEHLATPVPEVLLRPLPKKPPGRR
jgi:hypothetical protein